MHFCEQLPICHDQSEGPSLERLQPPSPKFLTSIFQFEGRPVTLELSNGIMILREVVIY